MKTSFPKPSAPQWFLLDAQGLVLGRIATEIARVLKGKHRPSYVPHVICGDHVIVLNAGHVKLTGQKVAQKSYFRHTGYFGGLKEDPVYRLMKEKPTAVLMHAVKGMLPKNAMRAHLLKRLHVYTGTDHEHAAQQPQSLPL